MKGAETPGRAGDTTPGGDDGDARRGSPGDSREDSGGEDGDFRQRKAFAAARSTRGMRVEFEFYGTLREAVGEKTVAREFDEGTTALEATRAVADDHERVRSLLFRSGGEVRPNVTVSVNGDPIVDGDDDVALSDGDELVLAPGVAGGDGGRRR